MNLFWETRKLTKQLEDHLTCFIAAALEADEEFRNAYATRILMPLSKSNVLPKIKEVKIQQIFKIPINNEEKTGRPDMILVLDDSRRIGCEHKIDAPETQLDMGDGKILRQIEKYLKINGELAAVAYFRPSHCQLNDAVLKNPLYLKPADAQHFLWSDLYEPLTSGKHEVTQWLLDGFKKLGFTPPVENIGKLWPEENDTVIENQKNFGMFWGKTREQLNGQYRIKSGRRCELYLEPYKSLMIHRAYVSPLAQDGTVLRLRLVPKDNMRERIENCLSEIALREPYQIETGNLTDGSKYIDILTSLWSLFHNKTGYKKEILFERVFPVLNAVAEQNVTST